MRGISDKIQNAVNTILNHRDADEIAYAYYKIAELVKDLGFSDSLTSEGERYINLADEL